MENALQSDELSKHGQIYINNVKQKEKKNKSQFFDVTLKTGHMILFRFLFIFMSLLFL
jgi:hypothetical protein